MQSFHVIENGRDQDPGQHETELEWPAAGRTTAAVVVAILVQYIWALACISQLEEPLFQICIMDSCDPIERPLRDSLLLAAIPVVGPLLSMATAIQLGFSLRRFSTWLLFLFGVPILAVVALVALALVLLIVVAALAA